MDFGSYPDYNSEFMMRNIKQEKIDIDDDRKLEPRKRGRTRSLGSKKPIEKADIKAKLEKSRQSAKECRQRKKLRYQYLEEIISEKEKSIFALRRELESLKMWALEMDEGKLPEPLLQYRRSCTNSEPHQQQQLLCFSPYGSLSPT